MERKLIITRWKEQVLTSLLENGEIVEFHCSPNETKEQAVLGNIYVGKVKNIVPNIGAAFVEVAKGVECYYALDENETPIFTQKIGKKLLCIGDELLVQVSKEAVKTKVPTVSGKLSFTGKYAVLTTGRYQNRNFVKASKRIERTFSETGSFLSIRCIWLYHSYKCKRCSGRSAES